MKNDSLLMRIIRSGYGLAGFGILAFGIIGRILQANGSDWNPTVAGIYFGLLIITSFYLIVKNGV